MTQEPRNLCVSQDKRDRFWSPFYSPSHPLLVESPAYTIAITDDTTGAIAEASFDVAAGPATFVLTAEVKSLEGGSLPLTPITIEPTTDEYENQEQVMPTALSELSFGGFRHFFAFWELTPERGLVLDSSNALNLPVNMVGNTSASAWYESTPEA